jgi:ABC-type cobalamin/Fe3+-siderophores transport system ATPase subunit
MMATELIPVSVLTGFLGSGKTTILSHMLRQPEFSDTAVVINEFGEIAVQRRLNLACQIKLAEHNVVRDTVLASRLVLGSVVTTVDAVAGELTSLRSPQVAFAVGFAAT